MTRELWNLIEEYIEARLELEKVPEDLRDDLAYGPVKHLRDVKRLRREIPALIQELANKGG